MVFQSKDGVMSNSHGWFRRSFEIAAVRAVIGSVRSGGGIAEGAQEGCF